MFILFYFFSWIKKIKNELIADRHVLVEPANSASNEKNFDVYFACGNDDACVFDGTLSHKQLFFARDKDAFRKCVYAEWESSAHKLNMNRPRKLLCYLKH